jgi:uncharacterized spore protein YtfJ
MLAKELFEAVAEKLDSAATVKRVFGEPITSGHKTVVPVARVAYGFGAGAGRGTACEPQKGQGEGEGGGGGIGVQPLGVLEITPRETRFVRFGWERPLAAAALAGFLVGWWFARRQK